MAREDPLSPALLHSLAELANDLADAAGKAALRHFRASRLRTENKAGAGDFDPVTAADREAESAMREILGRTRGDDGIFGEEHGQSTGKSGLTWVLDPIDGTRAFISGLPSWGILIALDDGTSGRIGVIDQPFTGERFVGVAGDGAWLTHGGETRSISTRACRNLSQATLMTTAPELFNADERTAFDGISAGAQLTRYGTDCYAYAMLAMGQIDLVIESGLEAYDIAAPAALIQAAGGRVTDWQGGDCRWGGRVLAAGDPELHEIMLEILREVPSA
ncbi:MAG: histidinol-phosphatase [Pseudomonadota bacterium]